jgi:glutathione S-transferase
LHSRELQEPWNIMTSRRLYELVLGNGLSASPFVWRIRYALAHKGLPFESVPLGFTDIPKVFEGRYKTVPVLAEGDEMIVDSWDIVDHLERAHPHRPKLFSSPAEYAMVRLFDACFFMDIIRKFFSLYALDIHDAARPEDQPYFRQSREQRFLRGTPLEAYVAGREARLPAVREALAPLRLQLSRSPFLGGTNPNYADYIVFGVFQWVAAVHTLPLLAKDDQPLRNWLDRVADLYDGLGRDPRMRPLFEH